jgi:hypothetical protein
MMVKAFISNQPLKGLALKISATGLNFMEAGIILAHLPGKAVS